MCVKPELMPTDAMITELKQLREENKILKDKLRVIKNLLNSPTEDCAEHEIYYTLPELVKFDPEPVATVVSIFDSRFERHVGAGKICVGDKLYTKQPDQSARIVELEAALNRASNIITTHQSEITKLESQLKTITETISKEMVTRLLHEQIKELGQLYGIIDFEILTETVQDLLLMRLDSGE